MINEPLHFGNKSSEIPLKSSTFISPFFDFNPQQNGRSTKS
jgi:hypothetical protein